MPCRTVVMMYGVQELIVMLVDFSVHNCIGSHGYTMLMMCEVTIDDLTRHVAYLTCHGTQYIISDDTVSFLLRCINACYVD